MAEMEAMNPTYQRWFIYCCNQISRWQQQSPRMRLKHGTIPRTPTSHCIHWSHLERSSGSFSLELTLIPYICLPFQPIESKPIPLITKYLIHLPGIPQISPQIKALTLLQEKYRSGPMLMGSTGPVIYHTPRMPDRALEWTAKVQLKCQPAHNNLWWWSAIIVQVKYMNWISVSNRHIHVHGTQVVPPPLPSFSNTHQWTLYFPFSQIRVLHSWKFCFPNRLYFHH